MAFTPSPTSFFGNGYSFGSNAITLRTAGHATGETPAAFTVVITGPATETDLLTLAAHGFAVNDRVRVTTSVADEPEPLDVGTDYWVVAVPTTGTFKVSTTKGGTPVVMTDAGTGTHSVALMGPLDEVTSAMADGGASDWRKVVAGIMEAMYQRWTRTATGARPTKLNISKSNGTLNGNNITTYTVRVTYASQNIADIAPE